MCAFLGWGYCLNNSLLAICHQEVIYRLPLLSSFIPGLVPAPNLQPTQKTVWQRGYPVCGISTTDYKVVIVDFFLIFFSAKSMMLAGQTAGFTSNPAAVA